MGQQIRLDLRAGRCAAVGIEAIVEGVEGLGLATQIIGHHIQINAIEAVGRQAVIDKGVATGLGGIAEGGGGNGHAEFLFRTCWL
ncbi:hypothetical protein D9M68_584810 [compost metagenome]